MSIEKDFKIALIRKGITKAKVATNLGITSVYLSQIVKRMDVGANELLPKSDKSKEIQRVVRNYVDESKKLVQEV